MLRRVLAYMDGDGARSLGDLALELGIGRSAALGMLERLGELGYVEELGAAAASCGDGPDEAACSGCGMAASCGCSATARVWSLSSKGRAAARAQVPAAPQ